MDQHNDKDNVRAETGGCSRAPVVSAHVVRVPQLLSWLQANLYAADGTEYARGWIDCARHTERFLRGEQTQQCGEREAYARVVSDLGPVDEVHARCTTEGCCFGDCPACVIERAKGGPR